MTYEVEIKVEITEAQLPQLLATCQARGFLDKGALRQCDYYVKAVLSKHGTPPAYDIERYRYEGGEIFYTKKEWDLEGGVPVRREEEHEVTPAEFDAAVEGHPNPLEIVKDRRCFQASFEGAAISLSIDSVKFDHSPRVRHFLEPEILVEDKAAVAKTRELLRRFLAFLLGIDVNEIVEAPGMFAMAFKKL
jgi:adenylate cyclase class IV